MFFPGSFFHIVISSTLLSHTPTWFLNLGTTERNFLLQVLKLLRIAFERQLTFTIGISVTTGLANTVTWNDIHHKTEGYQNRTGFGYPDNNYLDNVLAELASHGITDEE